MAIMDKQKVFKDNYVNSDARGIRNNNPGNIDYNKVNNWKGQLPFDKKIEPRFCRFESPEYGIRALIVLLRTYQRKRGLKTVLGLINRWAPSLENFTSIYVSKVSKEMGVVPTAIINLDDKETAIKMAKAIVQVENGQQPYLDDVFESAYALI